MCVYDIDFQSNLITVERGWDQVEGVIEPKSRAGRRNVPLLAILRDYLSEHVRRTDRSGDDLVFGRSLREAFYASTVDGRAKRTWTAASKREREAAEREDREPERLVPMSMHFCRHTFAWLMIDAVRIRRRIRSSWATRKSRPPSTSTAIFCRRAVMKSASVGTPTSGAAMSREPGFEAHAECHEFIRLHSDPSSLGWPNGGKGGAGFRSTGSRYRQGAC